MITISAASEELINTFETEEHARIPSTRKLLRTLVAISNNVISYYIGMTKHLLIMSQRRTKGKNVQ